MSTQTLTPPLGPGRSQALKALRIQLVDPWASTLLPWLIFSMSFAVNVLIFAVAGDGIPVENRTTGGISSLYVVALFANLASWTQVFPFALGLGLTRGAFIRGTGLLVLGQSAVVGVVLVVLKAVEQATGGWGVGMTFFALPYLDRDNTAAQFLVYAVPYLAVCAVGMVTGVVFKRWGQRGMWSLLVAGFLAGGAAVVLVTWQGAWGAVGRFFTTTDPMAMLVGYPALLAAVAGGIAFLLVRRATP